jgi:hypothetical protein
VYLLSSHQALRLYRIESLNLPRHPVTTAVTRTAIKGTLCTSGLKNPHMNSRQSQFIYIYIYGSTAPWGPRPPYYRRFTITHFRHTTLCRTPLEEGSARRRDLYLTSHNTHKRQTSMPPLGFEPTILVSERPQTHALDRAATGIGRQPQLCLTNQTLQKRTIFKLWYIDGIESDVRVLQTCIVSILISPEWALQSWRRHRRYAETTSPVPPRENRR